MTPEEKQKLAERLDLEARLAAESNPDAPYQMEADPNVARIEKAVEIGGKGLDYLGGAVRNVPAALPNASPDYKAAVKAALKLGGHFPSGAKALQEAGILKAGPEPEWPSLGAVIGEGYSALTDPLTYASFGGRAAKEAEALSPRIKYNPKVPPEAPRPRAPRPMEGVSAEYNWQPQPQLEGPVAQGNELQTWGVDAPPGSSGEKAVPSWWENAPLVEKPKSKTQRLQEAVNLLMGAPRAALQAPSKFMNWSGKKIYGSAFGPLDLHVPKENRKDIVEQLYKGGVWGGPTGRFDTLMAARNQAGEKLGALYREGDRRGSMVEFKKALGAAEAHANELVDAGLLEPEDARLILDDLAGTFKGTTMYPGLQQAARWKTQVQRGIPESRWTQLGRKNKQAESEAVANTLQAELSKQILAEAERTMGPGGRKRLEEANHLYGSLSDARRPVLSNSKREAGKSIFDMTDPLYATGEMINPNGPMGEALVVKKLIEAGATPTAKTTLGYTLRKAHDNPWTGTMVDTAMRRGLINMLQAPPDEE